METQLHVLILEDNDNDIELMLYQLRRDGFQPTVRVAKDRQSFIDHLVPSLDVILADYNLPQFDALRALRLMQVHGFDIPFIIVTGYLGDETAVHCMKQGATNYLLKDRMARLGIAVTNALAERESRKRQRSMEERLRHVVTVARCLLWDGIVEKIEDDLVWSVGVMDEHSAQYVLPLTVPPGGRYLDAFRAAMFQNDRHALAEMASATALNGQRGYNAEYRCRNLSGEIRWMYEDVQMEVDGENRWRVVGVCIDVTNLKESLEQSNEQTRRINAYLNRLVEERADELDKVRRDLVAQLSDKIE